ncbi:MAG TPA: zinc ribbon domain-containing protein [Actinomycetota bacterium]|nr:zinc ribbon domain-containing protein [Actinomycetota bacterium]
MNTCPHCGGEIRPSVIRCVHCGTALQPERQAAIAVAGAGRALAATGRPAGTTGPAPAPVPEPPGSSSQPEPGGDLGSTSDLWVTPPDGDGRRPTPAAEMPGATQGTRRVDGGLMGAAVLAVGTAVLAVSALSLAWMDGRLSVVGIRRTRAVAEITLQATDSYAGSIAIVIAATMSVLGLLWFWYGTDRSNHLPAFAHPAIALIVGLAGWAAIGAAMVGSFFWEHAFVERAQEAGLTPEAMQAILDDRTHRLIELEPLAGFQRFGIAATAAVLSGVVALWSQRPRRSR